MKQVRILLLLSFMLSALSTQAQDLVWGRQIDNNYTGNMYAHDNLTDKEGNTYIAGQFGGTVDFDPGPGFYPLISLQNQAAFISKYDSSGKLLWAKAIIGDSILVSGTSIEAIALDYTGSVYAIGYFYDTADFDPGLGTHELVSDYGRDMFIQKFDPSGNFDWVIQFKGTHSITSKDIAIDHANNVNITGTFGGTADFDPGPAVYNMTATPGALDGFIVRIDHSGAFLWAKQISGTASVYPTSLAVGENLSFYLAGYYLGTADFDPGTTTTYSLASNGYYDMFVAKYDRFGNMVWAHSFGAAHPDQAFDIACDGAGNTYTTGKFAKSVDFDPGAGSSILTSAGFYDAFVLKLDRNGVYQWVHPIGGSYQDEGLSISLSDVSVNVATTFYDIIDLDPGPGTFYKGTPRGFSFGYTSLDKAGNFKWAVTEANPASGKGACYMGEDAAGYIYATGRFYDTIDCDPGPAVYMLGAANSHHSYFIVKLKPATAPTTVQELEKGKHYSIYPNPSNGLIHISSTENIDKIVVSDITGKVIYNIQPAQKNATLNMVQPGMYMVSIISGASASVEKIIVTAGQ